MKRSLCSFGVLLCTPLSPLPLLRPEEEKNIELVILPNKSEMYHFFEFPSYSGDLSNDFLTYLDLKPISYYVSNNIPLCTVSTMPYGRDTVHKPPWFKKK
jgi:hypothetical protein